MGKDSRAHEVCASDPCRVDGASVDSAHTCGRTEEAAIASEEISRHLRRHGPIIHNHSDRRWRLHYFLGWLAQMFTRRSAAPCHRGKPARPVFKDSGGLAAVEGVETAVRQSFSLTA